MSGSSEDALAGAFFGGLVGLLIGAFGRKPEWENFAKQCEVRINHANFFKIRIPFGAYHAKQITRSSFAEAYAAYIFGLPNSSVAMSVKALEGCLKSKYKQVEGKDTQNKLIELIEWAESKLQLQRSNVAQAIRMLRNEVVHEDKIVEDSRAFETLKHTSEVMCEVFPYTLVNYPTFCPQCNRVTGSYPLAFDNAYIGYSLNLQCNVCRTVFPVRTNP